MYCIHKYLFIICIFKIKQVIFSSFSSHQNTYILNPLENPRKTPKKIDTPNFTLCRVIFNSEKRGAVSKIEILWINLKIKNSSLS